MSFRAKSRNLAVASRSRFLDFARNDILFRYLPLKVAGSAGFSLMGADWFLAAPRERINNLRDTSILACWPAVQKRALNIQNLARIEVSNSTRAGSASSYRKAFYRVLESTKTPLFNQSLGFAVARAAPDNSAASGRPFYEKP